MKRTAWIGIIAIVVAVIVSLKLPRKPAFETTGVVESARSENRGVEQTSVRLDDGSHIVATNFASAGPLSAGDRVLVVGSPQLLGYTTYQIVGKGTAPPH